MRIVQVAPDYIPVPPHKYGGIERLVFELVQELSNRGHEVFLYALPGSQTKAKLIPYQHQNDASKIAEFVRSTLPTNVDIIHDHTHASVIGCSGLNKPVVCTIHVPWWNKVKHPVFLNENMRSGVGMGKGQVVYPGINLNDYPVTEKKSGYFLFLGRLIREKGILQAIEVAQKAKRRLVVAGPSVDLSEPEDTYQYYVDEIYPRLHSNEDIVYVGEVADSAKIQLLRNADCLLFPSEIEAFGLVMIEAMACGTPVLALANGAVPEVLKDFPELICDSIETMLNKVREANFPDPHSLRNYVERHFTTTKMVDNYLKVYQDVAGIDFNQSTIRRRMPVIPAPIITKNAVIPGRTPVIPAPIITKNAVIPEVTCRSVYE